MMKIGHRRNVLFTDHQVWDTFTNVFSGCGGYSHSELVFSDGVSFTSTTDFNPFTAIFPKNRTHGGPIFRKIEYPEKLWRFTELPLNAAQEAEVFSYCMELTRESLSVDGGYDFAGVFRFVLPWMKEHPEDWFCSEAVIDACQFAGLFRNEKAWKVSPNRLWKLCDRIFRSDKP